MPELKSFDRDTQGSISGIAVLNDPGAVAAWQIAYLFYPVQGADIGNRIGRKAIIDKLNFKMKISSIQTAGDFTLAGHVRVIVVYDQQNNSLNSTATTQAAALLADPGNMESALLLDNRERFLVLWDKYLYLGASSHAAVTSAPSIASERASFVIKKFKQKMLKDVIFNGTNGGSNADVITGSLFVLFGSDKYTNDAGGICGNYNIFSRVRWHDC